MSKNYFILPDIDLWTHDNIISCDITDPWRITDHVLGQGSYGRVVTACQNEDCDFIAKQISFDFSRYPEEYVYNLFFAECLITQFAGREGFGIPVDKFFLCVSEHQNGWFGPTDRTQKGIMIMQKYDKDLETIKHDLNWDDMKQLLDKVTQMHRSGILHRDLFLKNTMCRLYEDGKKDIRIIDYGLSVAFEQPIPRAHRAIDYLNLISSLKTSSPTRVSLYSVCYRYIEHCIGRKAVKLATKWLNDHYDTCGSEHSLIRHLPVKWIRIMGPATVDTMVWSVRCSREQDTNIVNKTHSRIHKVQRQFRLKYKKKYDEESEEIPNKV
jgi:serine/threonine protein kinase